MAALSVGVSSALLSLIAPLTQSVTCVVGLSVRTLWLLEYLSPAYPARQDVSSIKVPVLLLIPTGALSLTSIIGAGAQVVPS